MESRDTAVKPLASGLSPDGGMRLDVNELVLSGAVRRKFPKLKPLELAVLHAIADYPMAKGSEIAQLCSCCSQTVSEIRNAEWFAEAMTVLGMDREPLFTAKLRGLKHLITNLIGREATRAAMKELDWEPTANQTAFLKLACEAQGLTKPEQHLHLHAEAGAGSTARLDVFEGFLEPFTPEKRDHLLQPLPLQVAEAE